MPNLDLNKCPKCGLWMIFEEMSFHKCMKITDYWVIGGIIWIGDGTKYYPFNNRHLTGGNINREDNRTRLKVLST